MLNTVATVIGIVEGLTITISVGSAFIPKVRKRIANHFITLVREASDEH